MALANYLDMVNDVLVRMRMPQVTTVNENVVSTLVGKYINDAKRQVADSYDWDAFNTAVTITTVAGQQTGYTLTGAGIRFKVINVINTSRYYNLTPISHEQWNNYTYTTPTVVSAFPENYVLEGVNSNGDMGVKLWPNPDGVYNLRFALVVPETNMVSDSDTTKLGYEPIVLGALSRALVERGEDGGMTSSEAYALYKASLADLVSLELARSPENDAFEAV
jgi:hypothetical protein